MASLTPHLVFLLLASAAPTNALTWTVGTTDHAFGPNGMYFNFNWPDNLATEDTTISVKQCRGGLSIWEGSVRIWPFQNGTSGAYNPYGRRSSGQAAGQWRTGDVITSASSCPQVPGLFNEHDTKFQVIGDQAYAKPNSPSDFLYIDMERQVDPSAMLAVNEYEHVPQACVKGHNIRTARHKTVGECEEICDTMPSCKGFEYGVDYGGQIQYAGGIAGLCRPQDSADYSGCDGKHFNMDFYIKKEKTQEGDHNDTNETNERNETNLGCEWSSPAEDKIICSEGGFSYDPLVPESCKLTLQVRLDSEKAHLGECASKGKGTVAQCPEMFPVMCQYKHEWGDYRCADTVDACEDMGAGSERVCAAKDLKNCVYLIVLCLCILPVKFACVYRYQGKQKKQEKETSMTSTIEEYTQKLVSRLMPSIQIESYQFQGISPFPEDQRISLQFDNLGMTLKSNGRCILEGVTGSMDSGNMSGILGPSGAGKTTFLNVLCGKAFYGNMTGTVKINGKVSEISTLQPVMGFVPQDDIVYEPLTVRENFYYSARLRNSKDTPSVEISRIVEDVVAVMQLRHVQNSVVGSVEQRGISGGQRKRVNIGLELAARPSIMFLDEPTSGLDATSALTVIQSIKKLTDIGMTVVMVIHQPRYQLYELCDEVLLLGVGGRTVYTGDAIGAKPYFERVGFVMPQNENPADWFMDIISGEVPNSKDKDFKPIKLFKLWEDYLMKPPAAHGEKKKRLVRKGSVDDSFLRQELSAAFNKLQRRGYIQKNHLQSFLSSCMDSPTESEALEQIFSHMSSNKEDISKQSFIDFFLNLQRVSTAESKEQPTPGANTTGTCCDTCYVPLLGSKESSTKKVSGRDHKERSSKKMGFCGQFVVCLQRVLITWNRQTGARFIGYSLVFVAALIQGLLRMNKIIPDDQQFPMTLFMTQTNLALLVAINRLKVFGNDRPMFWRESSSGINILSFYLSRIMVDTIATAVEACVFVATWYAAASIRGSIIDLFLPSFVAAAFVGAGVGYVVSTVVPPTNATLAAAVVIMIFGAATGMPNLIVDDTEHEKEWLFRSSFLVWSLSMGYVKSVKAVGGPKIFGTQTLTLLGRNESDCEDGACSFPAGKFYAQYHYLSSDVLGDLEQQRTCLLVLITFAIVLYIGGYLGLRFTNREKQV